MRIGIRSFLALLALSCVVFGADVGSNMTGWSDTVGVVDSLRSAAYVTTPLFDMSRNNISTDGMYAIVAANGSLRGDTSAALDSLHFFWGYQPGFRVLNKAGTLDTLWMPRVIVDTFTLAALGKALDTDVLLPQATGIPTTVFGNTTDTTSVSGYTCQARYIKPFPGELCRFWFKGLGDMAKTGNIRLKVTVKNRVYTATRGK